MTTACLPLIAFMTWWLIAWSFYLVRWPIPYAGTNFLQVNLLIGATVALSTLAFLLASRPRALPPAQWTARTRPPVIALVGLGASVLLLIPFAELYSGFHVWEVFAALLDQGAAFRLSSERIAEGTETRLVFVGIQAILAPATLMVIPYFGLTWLEQRKHGWYLVVGLAVPVVNSVLVGRDFQMIMALVLLAAVWMIARVRSGRVVLWRDVGLAGSIALVGLTLFVLRRATRGAVGVTPSCLPGGDADACAVDVPAGPLESSVAIIASYASQSLEGLGRALGGDWVFGGGYAHSLALRNIIDSALNRQQPAVITDQLESLEWSSLANWSTGLTFIANDVPWMLVPVVVALHVAVLGFLWRSAAARGDWLSTTLFCYTFLSVLFLLQNLQLALSGPLYLGYIFLLGLFAARAGIEAVRMRRRAEVTR